MDFRFKFRREKPSTHEVRREKREDRELTRRMRGVAIGLSIPMGMVGGPIAGWLLGNLLDNALGTDFWMITLVCIGTVSGIWMTIEMLMKLGRNNG